jgi:hypothetical protein
MIAAIFLLGAALFGVGLMERALRSHLRRVEHWFFGLALGWAVVTAFTYVVTGLVGRLTLPTLLAVTAASWLAAIGLWLPRIRSFRDKARLTMQRVRARRDWYLLGLMGFLAPLYLVLFRTHMLERGLDGSLYSGGASATYDLAFHAAVTTSFLYGGNFPPVYTAMPPAPLLYPFLPDFQTAILVSLGLSLQTALVLTGVIMALALSGIFYLFALSVLRLIPAVSAGATEASADDLPSRRASLLATVLFLFNGGLGFLYFFRDWWAQRDHSLAFLSPLQSNYANMADHGIVWANLIADALLPQRTTLFGMSLGLIVLTLFARAWRDSERRESETRWPEWRVFLGAGVITGLLPYFHPHSFAAIGMVSGFLFVLRPRRGWFVFWASALLLAAPYLGPLARHVAGPGFLRFQPGWPGKGDSGWVMFTIRNLGLSAVLIVPAWLSCGATLRRFYLAFGGLLAVSLLVVFSPNDYDNLKLIYYWYGATAIIVSAWLLQVASRKRVLTVLVVLSIFASIASGVLAVVYELQTRTLIFTRDEVTAAEFVRTQTAPRSLFLTAPSLHQPVLSLAGRAIVRGPTAWLWSHGYPFPEREADVRAIYTGREDVLDLLCYYQVDYIYVGPREREELRANQDFSIARSRFFTATEPS